MCWREEAGNSRKGRKVILDSAVTPYNGGGLWSFQTIELWDQTTKILSMNKTYLMSTSEQLSRRFFPQDKFFSVLAQAECWIWLPWTKEEHNYTVNLRKLKTPEYKKLWSKGKCCDQVEWKKIHFNNNIDIYPCSLIWTNQIKTKMNWNEEKIKKKQ